MPRNKRWIFIFKDGHTETGRGWTPGEAFRSLGYSLADTDLVENWDEFDGGNDDE